MGKKLGGYVCDKCLIFCDYGYTDSILKWFIVASNEGEFYYCSEKCRDSHDRSKDE
jgi:hypothetical protein